ncbi:hypothetical protein NKH77_49550 [Streptomyces sp. M19]
MRAEGTAHLIAAARAAGARRIVAQSIAFATAPHGGPVLTEDAALYLDAPDPGWARTVGAVAELERQVLRLADLSGAVLRYGTLYGPGPSTPRTAGSAARWRAASCRCRGPPPGSPRSCTSRTPRGGGGRRGGGGGRVFNVTDDEPAEAAVWLPEYARLRGGPAPDAARGLRRADARLVHRVPADGDAGRGQRPARQALGWKPAVPSWRTGLAAD